MKTLVMVLGILGLVTSALGSCATTMCEVFAGSPGIIAFTSLFLSILAFISVYLSTKRIGKWIFPSVTILLAIGTAITMNFLSGAIFLVAGVLSYFIPISAPVDKIVDKVVG